MTQQGSSGKKIIGNADILQKYYAYGIRNGYGLDFDPISGKLWDTENGPAFGDEINLVEPGFNSGWSRVQGKWNIVINSSGEPTKGEKATKETLNLVDFGGKGRYSAPEFIWNNTVGPTSLIFLKTDKLGKEYKNNMLVSDIKNGRIYHFKLNEKRDSLDLAGTLADKVADSDEEASQLIFGSGFGGITDMEVGPDGYLYVLSFGKGSIYRISPK